MSNALANDSSDEKHLKRGGCVMDNICKALRTTEQDKTLHRKSGLCDDFNRYFLSSNHPTLLLNFSRQSSES